MKVIKVSNSNKFLKTSAIYMIGIVSSKLISFILLPLYTGYLHPTELGYYDLVLSILNFLIPISYFQIWDGMFRFSFDYKDNVSKYKVISNSYFIFFFGIAIYITILFLLNQIFPLRYFNLVLLYGFTFALNYLYSFIARTFLKNKLFVISGLLNTFISSIINIVLIVRFNFGIESLFIAQIVGSLVQVTIIEMNIRSLSKVRLSSIDKQIIVKMLRFSIPLCIATISYWLLSGFTVININSQLGIFENGIYSVANKFSSLIAVGVSIFQYAWNELAYLMSSEIDRAKKYESMIELLFMYVIVGSGFLLLIIKFVFPILIDVAYIDALVIIPVSLFGVASNSIAGLAGTIFSSEKKTKWTLWSTIIASFFNIFFSIILTKKYGLIGANIALTSSFIVLTIIRIIVMRIDFNIVIHNKNYVYILYYIFNSLLYYFVDYKYLSFAIIFSLIIALIILKDSLIMFIKDILNSI